MSKQIALILSFIEDSRTSVEELRELKKNVEQLLMEQSENDAHMQKLCTRIMKAVDEEILVRSLLKGL